MSKNVEGKGKKRWTIEEKQKWCDEKFGRCGPRGTKRHGSDKERCSESDEVKKI